VLIPDRISKRNITMSPEILMQNEDVAQLLQEEFFIRMVAAFIFDKAHCVLQ